MRSAFAQSTRHEHALAEVGRQVATQAVERQERVLVRQGRVAGRAYMTASLPSCRSASVIASSEPSASPSGFSCETTTKRSCSRSASATACRSRRVIFVSGELVDQAGHAHAALDRRIVSKASWGVRFIRSSRARRLWRRPCAASSPCSVAFCLRRDPSTLTKTRRVREVGGRGGHP